MKRKVLALILALVCIVTAFSGCGEKEEPTGAAADGIKISGVNEFPIVEEPIEFTVFATKSAFVADHETNEFTKWYEEKTGIHINWIVPSGDAQQSFNLMIASGEYPDFILGMGLSREQMMSLISQGIAVDIKDEIEEHGHYIKKMFEEEPSAEEYVTFGDAIYGVPKINAGYSSRMQYGMWVYQPWLDKLGLEMPQTTEEFYQMLKAFKEQDPNGNGKADEIPLSGRGLGANWSASVEPFLMSAFIPTNDRSRTYIEDDVVKHVALQPEYREGLRYFRKLYKEGLLYQDTFIIDRNQITAMGESEVPILGASTGSYPGYFCTPGGTTERYFEFEPVPPLEGPNGVRASVAATSVSGGTSFIVTKECKYPDIAVKWVDWLLSHEGKKKSQDTGLTYERPAKEGELGLDGQQALYAIEQESEEEKAKYSGSVQNLSWQNSGIWYSSYEDSVRTYNPDPVAEMNYKFYKAYEPYAVYTFKNITISEEDVDEYTDYQLIRDEIDNYFVKFVTGELDIDDDKDWEKYLNALDGVGINNYIKLLQRNYDANNK